MPTVSDVGKQVTDITATLDTRSQSMTSCIILYQIRLHLIIVTHSCVITSKSLYNFPCIYMYVCTPYTVFLYYSLPWAGLGSLNSLLYNIVCT